MALCLNSHTTQTFNTEHIYPQSLFKGDVDTFLQWNTKDPVSDFEIQRNTVISVAQRDRNPFIDNHIQIKKGRQIPLLKA